MPLRAQVMRGRMEWSPKYESSVVQVEMQEEERCPDCGKLILKGHLPKGTAVELFCTKCRKPFKRLVL